MVPVASASMATKSSRSCSSCSEGVVNARISRVTFFKSSIRENSCSERSTPVELSSCSAAPLPWTEREPCAASRIHGWPSACLAV
eukprot:4527606-Prymnesium_polylepis.1